MKALIYLLLFCATAAQAQTKLPPADAKAVRLFMTARMPEFNVRTATLREAMAAMRKEWTRQFPQEKFPVAIFKGAESMELGGSPMRLTMAIADNTFFQALKRIAGAWLCGIETGNAPGALFILKHSEWDDQGAGEFPITPGLLAALGLQRDAPPSQVQDALARAGIRWKHGMCGVFLNGHLVVKGSQDIIENVGCIYLMIDAGMKIEEMKF